MKINLSIEARNIPDIFCSSTLISQNRGRPAQRGLQLELETTRMLRKNLFITVAAVEELRRRSYWNRLKMAVLNTGIGEREWPTEIQNMFLHADMQGAKFRYECGKPFPIPLVDDVWGNERYTRIFLSLEECVYPAKDRLYDTFFRVKFPNIARHFGR